MLCVLITNYILCFHSHGFGLLKFYMKGPEKELLQLAVFGELLALFPGVHIHIDLVGPAIHSQRSDALLISNYSVI